MYRVFFCLEYGILLFKISLSSIQANQYLNIKADGVLCCVTINEH